MRDPVELSDQHRALSRLPAAQDDWDGSGAGVQEARPPGNRYDYIYFFFTFHNEIDLRIQ